MLLTLNQLKHPHLSLVEINNSASPLGDYLSQPKNNTGKSEIVAVCSTRGCCGYPPSAARAFFFFFKINVTVKYHYSLYALYFASHKIRQ